VHSVFGEVSDRCFIDNISGAPVSAATAAFVLIDSDGRLGTFTVDGPDPGGFSPKGAPKGIRPQAIPDAQAMLNRKVEALEATVAELRGQLKEQAEQIQKVSAHLETGQPATKVASNKP
jgi:Tfp pilus assembly protein FimV